MEGLCAWGTQGFLGTSHVEKEWGGHSSADTARGRCMLKWGAGWSLPPLLPVLLPAVVCLGMQLLVAQRLGFLLPTWKTLNKFSAPDFNLARP